MIDDTVLLLRFKSGSDDALGLIYQKYKGPLLKLACALASDVGLAEDAVHDVFVVLAQSGPRISPYGNLKSYLATCVVNRIRNHRKRKQHEPVSEDTVTEPVASARERPEQWIIANEAFSRLHNALMQLPYEQREVVLLHLEGGMRFRGIAKLQGVSINTVQSRYRYSLQKLRALLGDEVKL
ncbi:RNA polymerase sigma factor [Planctomycetota bacterium]